MAEHFAAERLCGRAARDGGLTGALLAPVVRVAREPEPPEAEEPEAPSRDFDFMLGDWIVTNRRLAGARWESFDTTLSCRPLLHGLAQVDEIDGHGAGAMAVLRVFDRVLRQWTIHQVAAEDGAVRGPLYGRFEGGTGVFVGEDRRDGRVLLLRHVWTDTASPRPRWERARSADGGLTWETDWIMELERVHWPR